MNHAASWSVFDGWRAPAQQLNWDAAEAWAPAFDRLTAVAAQQLDAVLSSWDRLFADLGGDPSRTNWESFRPLRRSREEDWSDWLAFLLEQSASGQFGAMLFAGDTSDTRAWTATVVDREVRAENYRADLVVRFADGEWLHVEVKVGDQQLEKTPATGAALRRRPDGRCRGDWLLLPDSDRPVWESVTDECDGAMVHVVTWTDLARALRTSIIDRAAEKLVWRAWAFAFVGAIEQDLLGFPPIPPDVKRRLTARVIERLRYLEASERK